MGTLTRAEKSGFGRFLDDVTYIFADVTVSSLPALLYVWANEPDSELALTAPALAAWTTMVVVGTLIRGGWITPVGSKTLGWVSTRLSLLGARLVYFNLVLLTSVYGSFGLAALIGIDGLVVPVAVAIGATATLAFPRIADELYDRFVRP